MKAEYKIKRIRKYIEDFHGRAKQELYEDQKTGKDNWYAEGKTITCEMILGFMAKLEGMEA